MTKNRIVNQITNYGIHTTIGTHCYLDFDGKNKCYKPEAMNFKYYNKRVDYTDTLFFFLGN